MLRVCLVFTLAMTTGGCRKAPPEASRAFSDAVRDLFREMESPEAVVANLILEVEQQIYLGMDVEASSPNDRALTPANLRAKDIVGLDHPGRDLSAALPVAVATVSAHSIEQHKSIQLLKTQVPVEPYSPEFYQRTFLEGDDCWEQRNCDWLRTSNELTKENLLMTIDYFFPKDFRWVNLSSATGDTDPRWAYIARSWTTEVFAGRKDNAWIQQSYSIEVWVPRDGRGFSRTASDKNNDEGTWTSDSNGDGLLRMVSLWSETEFDGLAVTDDQVAATTRSGIDRNFQAAEDYLDEQ
jgi:hypothetical protein